MSRSCRRPGKSRRMPSIRMARADGIWTRDEDGTWNVDFGAHTADGSTVKSTNVTFHTKMVRGLGMYWTDDRRRRRARFDTKIHAQSGEMSPIAFLGQTGETNTAYRCLMTASFWWRGATGLGMVAMF